MHFHRCLHKVRTQRALRDELAFEERYAVVIADNAFLLNAQDLRQVQSWHRDERAALPFGLDREPRVVRWYSI